MALTTFRLWWHKVVAVANITPYNNSTLIPLPQVGVAVHHYLLIGGGAREGSVSWDGGCIGCCLSPNDPNHTQHILHPIILTPEGDVASSTHTAKGQLGGSE